MANEYVLYGMAASLYTARARSYMRVNAVPFTEVKAGSAEFLGEIVPAIGRWIIPVLKTPDGAIIQDGADIIDHLDNAGFSRHSPYPDDPGVLAIGHIFELFGAHGLLRPAMHYRWNFDDVNLPFIRDTFRDVIPQGLSPEAQEAVFLQSSGRMRKAAFAVGATPDAIPMIEQSYAEFLSLMNAHLDAHPFMLGEYPTIADYGLIGAMYAHLGRDPAPLQIMQTTAPRVFRWVERMNMAEDIGDTGQSECEARLFDSSALPATLKAILRFIARDYVPEITAHVAYADAWLEDNPEVTTGTSTKDPIMQNGMGLAPFSWRGVSMRSVVLPYRFYLLGRLRNAVKRQSKAAQNAIHNLCADIGLEPLLTLKTKRPIERIDNHEAWGELER